VHLPLACDLLWERVPVRTVRITDLQQRGTAVSSTWLLRHGARLDTERHAVLNNHVLGT